MMGHIVLDDGASCLSPSFKRGELSRGESSLIRLALILRSLLYRLLLRKKQLFSCIARVFALTQTDRCVHVGVPLCVKCWVKKNYVTAKALSGELSCKLTRFRVSTILFLLTDLRNNRSEAYGS